MLEIKMRIVICHEVKKASSAGSGGEQRMKIAVGHGAVGFRAAEGAQDSGCWKLLLDQYLAPLLVHFALRAPRQ